MLAHHVDIAKIGISAFLSGVVKSHIIPVRPNGVGYDPRQSLHLQPQEGEGLPRSIGPAILIHFQSPLYSSLSSHCPIIEISSSVRVMDKKLLPDLLPVNNASKDSEIGSLVFCWIT